VVEIERRKKEGTEKKRSERLIRAAGEALA